MDNIKQIKEILTQNADTKYQKFSASLLPNTENILGVRLPILRKIAKEISKGGYENFLDSECEYFEETMLQGMVIGLAVKNISQLKLIEKFIPKINNWSVCDSFCCGLKFTSQYKKEVWDFLQKYLYSKKEFEMRFAHVMLINYFIGNEYLENIFTVLNQFKSDKYYAQMSVAWLISECFVKYHDETMEFLKYTRINDFTYNKSIQKIIESYRVDKSTKKLLKKYKK